MQRSARLLAAALLAAPTHGAYCHGSPSPTAKPNLNPIQTSLRTVRSVRNGVLQVAGDADDAISVVHLWGSARERGLAHGELMRDAVAALVPAALGYFEDQFRQALNGSVPWIPSAVAAWIAKVGMDAALDETHALTTPFTGHWFEEEMGGLAEASGVPLAQLVRLHMIGELTQGHCSMFGAWGGATATGALLQLRSLDWDTGGPFQRFPQVSVYHSDGSDAQGGTFAAVGWSGWIGAVSGMSAAALGVSEIGVTFPDASFGAESRRGVPFTFLLRDALQFDASLAASRARIRSAARTCDLILGVGDGKPQPPSDDGAAPFNSVQYSASVARFMNDTTLRPVNDTWHKPLAQVVYHGMDWLCPAYSAALRRQLAATRGRLTAPLAASHVVPVVQTGDLHVALYDLTPGSLSMLVANAAAPDEAGPPMAYDRPFVRLDMERLFAEAPRAVERGAA